MSDPIKVTLDEAGAADRLREYSGVLRGLPSFDQEVLKARLELRQEAARLAVQLAEQSLKDKLETNDQNRLVAEYLTKVVELP